MSVAFNNLTIEQADDIYLPALNVGYLSEGMRLLQLMDKLRLKSVVIESQSTFDDNNYYTRYEIESVELDEDAINANGGIEQLQYILCREFDAELDDFSDNPGVKEMENYFNECEFLYEQLNEQGIDLNFVVNLMALECAIDRSELEQRVKNVIEKDLAQLATMSQALAA